MPAFAQVTTTQRAAATFGGLPAWTLLMSRRSAKQHVSGDPLPSRHWANTTDPITCRHPRLWSRGSIILTLGCQGYGALGPGQRSAKVADPGARLHINITRSDNSSTATIAAAIATPAIEKNYKRRQRARHCGRLECTMSHLSTHIVQHWPRTPLDTTSMCNLQFIKGG